MNNALPADVLAYSASARRRLAELGGVDLALRAERDPDLRGAVGRVVHDLSDVDVREDLEQFLAGAELARLAGGQALPWPVVEGLLGRDGGHLALVDLARPRVDHGDLDLSWTGVDLDGTAAVLERGTATAAKLGPFLVPARVGAALPPAPAWDVAAHLVLGAWRLLGTLQTCVRLVVEHVTVREQFDHPLAHFQTVRFRVADAVVALTGLEELAKFTAWRLFTAPGSCSVDALAFRLHSAEQAVCLLRTSHQLLGAVGFCDEHDVSVLDRHAQPLVRLPLAAERLAERLVPAVSRGEFEGLFPGPVTR